MDKIIQESLDLLKRIEHVSDPAEIELYTEAEKQEGFARKIKYEPTSNGTRIKFSLTGNIFYIDLPEYISNKREAFKLIDSVLQRLNTSIYPAKFVNVSNKKKQKEAQAEK